MKRISVSMLILLSLPAFSQDQVDEPNLWDKTKSVVSVPLKWTKGSTETANSFESLQFKDVYKVKVWEKSYFEAGLVASAVLAAGVFSYATAGAGAPAAAAGVSSVASTIAGGGAGSYMAGLSTVGGFFGGNAMLGSAILNGVSMGVTIGGAAGTSISMAASIYDGAFAYKDPETGELTYKFHIPIPVGLGDEQTKALISQIHDLKKEISDIESDPVKLERLESLLSKKYQEGLELLQERLDQENDQESLLALSILAWQRNDFSSFSEAIKKIEVTENNESGFYQYLKGVDAISRGDRESAITFLRESIEEEPYALEPVIALINIIASQDSQESELAMELLAERISNNLNSDKYQSSTSLTGVYYRLGVINLSKKRYEKAAHYFKEAQSASSWFGLSIGNGFQKNQIKVSLASALYLNGSTGEAQSIIDEVKADTKNETQLKLLLGQYAGHDDNIPS